MNPAILRVIKSLISAAGITPEVIAAYIDEFRKKADAYVSAQLEQSERLARIEAHLGIGQNPPLQIEDKTNV